MDDHRHDVLVLRNAEERHTDRHLGGDIERGGGQGHHPSRHGIGIGVLHGQSDIGSLRREDLLHRTRFGVGVDRPQSFVAFDEITDGRCERVGVQMPGQPQCHRDVVGSRCTVEPVEEPHASLRQRQRNLLWPLTSDQLHASASDSRLDTTRKVTDRGRFEEQTHRYGGVEGAAEP